MEHDESYAAVMILADDIRANMRMKIDFLFVPPDT